VHLRQDPTCLNCGTKVQERYCSHCGQENTEPVESLGHLVSHFLQDVTHYDSKFFISIKDLLLKPGFLTREYNEGKRVKYLNPIRMYVFISAIFFLVLFATKKDEIPAPPKAAAAALVKDTSQTVAIDASGADIHIRISGGKYQRLSQYDSAQQALPESARDKGSDHYLARKVIKIESEHPGEREVVITQSLSHNIPKIMFVLLPLFAFYVSIWYRRRNHYYSQFAIFSLHFHSFIFLLFLLVIAVSGLINSLAAGLTLLGITWLALFAYLTAALSGAYHEAWWLSTLKALAIGFMYFLTLLIGIAAVGILTFVLA